MPLGIQTGPGGPVATRPESGEHHQKIIMEYDTGSTSQMVSTSSPLPVQVGNGDDVTTGSTTDTAVTSDASGTVSGKLRGIVKWAYERMPGSLGQKTMANSLPVVIASNQSDVNTAVPDGNDETLGATEDTAVTSDVAGTVSGKLRGLVKWAYERMPLSLGQTLMSNSFPVVIASNQSNIPVAVAEVDTRIVKDISGVTINVGSSTYSAGDLMGGKFELTNAVSKTDGTGVLESVAVRVNSTSTDQFDILIFREEPTNSTFTDNSLFTPHLSDLPLIIGFVEMDNNIVISTRMVGQKIVNMPVYSDGGDASLWACLVSRGTGVYPAQGLELIFIFNQD